MTSDRLVKLCIWVPLILSQIGNFTGLLVDSMALSIGSCVAHMLFTVGWLLGNYTHLKLTDEYDARREARERQAGDANRAYATWGTDRE